MKYLCEGCERLVEPQTLHLEGDELRLGCPHCAQVTVGRACDAARGPAVPAAVEPIAISRSPQPVASSATATAPGPVERSPAVEGDGRPERAPRVPSSPGPDPGSLAAEWAAPPGCCPRCVAPRTDGRASCAHCGLAFARYDAQAEEPPDWLLEEWLALRAAWLDVEAHAQLLERSSIRGELAALGRLYRVAESRSADDAVARRGREAVLRRAAAFPSRSEAGAEATPRVAPWKYVVAIGFVVLSVALVFSMLGRWFRSS